MNAMYVYEQTADSVSGGGRRLAISNMQRVSGYTTAQLPEVICPLCIGRLRLAYGQPGLIRVHQSHSGDWDGSFRQVYTVRNAGSARHVHV
jgi:hypothetical protein